MNSTCRCTSSRVTAVSRANSLYPRSGKSAPDKAFRATRKFSNCSRNFRRSSGSNCSIGRDSLVLRRLIRYCETVYGLSEQIIAAVKDPRLEPRILLPVLLKTSLVMFWSRLGSLNAVEQHRTSRFWKYWVGRSPASADTMGRVHAGMASDSLRHGLHYVYSRLKRNKALPPIGGLDVAVLDGHETHASYRRYCSGCLQRTIHTEHGDRTQYYHRYVTLQLLTGSQLRLLLDLEPQRPHEDEVTTAMRLLNRVLARYPRAFQLLLADGLYAQAPFINLLLAHSKHALVVLKDERRDLYQDACGLFKVTPPQEGKYRSRHCWWWDVEDLSSWPQVEAPMRVIRSQETYSVRRQASRQVESFTSEWIWATTLPAALAPTPQAVVLGHRRWDIENYGFNELANEWHSDHVYKHNPKALESFLLIAFLAYNLFHAFRLLNLKPEIQRSRTQRYWAWLMACELCPESCFAEGSSP